MFSRYFLMLCAFALFAGAIVSAVNEDEVPAEQNSGEVESRNPLLAVAVRVLAGAFRWAAKNCLEEAAKNCKQHWKKPKALISCGGRFLKANKGRCVTG